MKPGSVANGILDRGNDDNPFRDWTIAVVLYCTGDVHCGNGMDNGPNIGDEYHFKGRVNTKVCVKKHVIPCTNFLSSGGL